MACEHDLPHCNGWDTIQRWTANNLLCVLNAEPSYGGLDAGSEENANLFFGPMADTTSQTTSQSFVATNGDLLSGRDEGRVKRRPLILPPPDNLRWFR
jgi:hypothetical protein